MEEQNNGKTEQEKEEEEEKGQEEGRQAYIYRTKYPGQGKGQEERGAGHWKDKRNDMLAKEYINRCAKEVTRKVNHNSLICQK